MSGADRGERRQHVELSDEQIEAIAERAAEKAIEKMTTEAYATIGRGVVNKLMWMIGVITVGTFIWASSKGLIK